jgi:hypothetical protein
VLCARPGGEIVAALSNEFEGKVRAKAVDLGDAFPSSVKSAARASKANLFA